MYKITIDTGINVNETLTKLIKENISCGKISVYSLKSALKPEETRSGEEMDIGWSIYHLIDLLTLIIKLENDNVEIISISLTNPIKLKNILDVSRYDKFESCRLCINTECLECCLKTPNNGKSEPSDTWTKWTKQLKDFINEEQETVKKEGELDYRIFACCDTCFHKDDVSSNQVCQKCHLNKKPSNYIYKKNYPNEQLFKTSQKIIGESMHEIIQPDKVLQMMLLGYDVIHLRKDIKRGYKSSYYCSVLREVTYSKILEIIKNATNNDIFIKTERLEEDNLK